MVKTLHCFVIWGIVSLFSINNLSAQTFSEPSGNSGINFVHDGLTANDVLSIGTGAAWIDYDNDGDQDIYLTMRYTGNKLFENDGSGSFSEVANAMGADDAGNDGAGVAVADFNNDGWVDMYLANGDEDRLFLNVNGTAFEDWTSYAGFDMTDDSRGTSASWGDFDNDGYLDLYVSHHNLMQGAANSSKQDKLYYNNGDTTFTDVSHLLPLADLLGFGFIGGWTDYDNDGDLDIILVNDCLSPFIGTKLFENIGTGPSGDPTVDWMFNEVGVSEGIIESPGVGDCRHGMGLAVGDFDRDSYMDIYYSNVGDAVLFCNGHSTGGAFRDSSTEAGVNGQVFPFDFSWGTFFFDYDLDGWQDLYLIMGSHHYPSNVEPRYNMLYNNNGDHTFTDVSTAAMMGDSTRGRTGVFADYDLDGDPDVFLANFGEAGQLKRNDNANGNNYIWIKLEGTVSNRDGIGARLKLTTPDGNIQYFETRSGSSLGGGDQMGAHFGLGTNASITSLEITWPSGIVETINNPPINSHVTYTENGPLDVSLSFFNAHLTQREEVDLDWTTLSELNNHSFVIQRSINSKDFNDIGSVPGKGTSNVAVQYTFTDPEPVPGYNYYRLKQIDFDESVTYGLVRQINYRPSSDLLQVYPNPFENESLKVSYMSKTNQFQLKIVDAFGRTVHQEDWTGQANRMSNFEVKLNHLDTGVYFLIVEDAQHKEAVRILKQ